MRTKKAAINILISVFAFVAGFLPMIAIRKVFLNSLGPEMLGLNSLYNNIIGYLSIVEMGIGTAIIFSLYKPFAENDRDKIRAYLYFYKKMYSIIGLIILIIGILLSLILNLFITDNIDIGEARLFFLLVLLNTVIGYYFSYKFCVLIVSQKGYKVTVVTTIAKLVTAILQYVVLNITPNFYLYLIIQIAVNLLGYIFLNLYINKKFGWLRNIESYRLDINEKLNLKKNIKALIYHKFGGVVLFGTDNLIISAFINLATVTRYSNYSLIINAVQGITGTAMSAITASIGNLLVEKDKAAAYAVHKRLFFINFWVSSLVVIILYNTTTQFISVWLGHDQTIDNFTLSIIMINLYIQLMRGTVEKFNEGGGKYYHDRFAPLFESFINLIASIILVKILGLTGVFIGTLISNLAVVFWVKPKITYKYIFHVRLTEYFSMYFKYLFIGLFSFVICYFISYYLKSNISLTAVFMNSFVNAVVINVLYIALFWRNDEFKYFKNQIKKIILPGNKIRQF
ncbi:lipopolysaccharide biosynthesis protein [Paenibacillus sp. YAF4_2]|uniref:lipopolysaccharide biosynthesis protein n=1 Tax=Paenibacillus sp. YAF4_2 TaxID=3233085 RepID=UPI003F993EF9